MVRALARPLSLMIVNEYPKSGGSWFGEMLGEAMKLPFPRNQTPALQPCIMHGHYLYRVGMHNVVVVWRDGRDIMTSYYYHCFFKNDRGNEALVTLMRRKFLFEDYNDIRLNLPFFIERTLTRPIRPRFTWQRFVSEWFGSKNAIQVRYEDLLSNAARELERVIMALGRELPSTERLAEVVEEYSFRRQSGRIAGTESKGKFLRKGVAGDWKNCFTREACEIFDHYAGDALMALNYEADRSWVSKER